ncbi:hypothetical protein HAZT_HAZT003032, partial [Hyalella azteca]
ITVCFDPIFETNLFSYHIVRGENIAARDPNPSTPSVKSDTGFFTVSANTCYMQASQITLMETILGDSSVINVNQSLYFARNLLATGTDFVTEQEQDAGYYYINAAPLWQTINNGNWKYLESSVRDMAAAHGSDIAVWCGGWDVLQLDDVNGNPVDIFLGLTQNETVIPAPDVLWKVVFDPSSNEAAAIVGVNNPYLKIVAPLLCPGGSICDQLTWLHGINYSDYEAGAIYCCTVQDLATAIPNVPDLGSAGLLTA